MNKIRLEIRSINDQTAAKIWNSLPIQKAGWRKIKTVPIKMESDLFMKILQLYRVTEIGSSEQRDTVSTLFLCFI